MQKISNTLNASKLSHGVAGAPSEVESSAKQKRTAMANFITEAIL